MVPKKLYVFFLIGHTIKELGSEHTNNPSWDLVAHPVTQGIGEQALVDILDLSEVVWTCWGVSTPCSGLGLRMVKELRPAAGTGNE